MKSYELMPTHENLLATYLDDTIGRDRDIFSFVDILNSVDDCCSIALDGYWGSGKTFFIKQVKLFLDAHNDFVCSMNEDDKESIKLHWSSMNRGKDSDFQPQVCVYYDAWANDNDSDPILSLVYSIINNVDSDFKFSDDTDCLKRASAILEFFTDKNWTTLVESLKSSTPLDDIRYTKAISEEINEFLESLLIEKGNRLIIFIDELDRCNPNYAVKLLERIKHYFSNDRITFVFSINTKELQHTIKCFYGNDFDACRYLDRFFDLRISLPPADYSKFYQSINFSSSRYNYDVVCDTVIKTYNFSLREIAKYIKLTKIAAYEPTHESSKYNFNFPDEQAVHFSLMYILPIMIGIKIVDANRYESFITGKDSTPMIDVLTQLNTSRFYNLLSKDEVFIEDGNANSAESIGSTSISLADKLNQVYKAIFATNYSGSFYNMVIGKYEFNEHIKNMLLRTSSLFSNYTNVEIT